MNKLEALKILIEHSFLLTEEAKKELILKIYNFDDEKVDVLGKFFANEKIKAIEGSEEAIATYDDLLVKLQEEGK